MLIASYLILLTGCTSTPLPDLKRLYETQPDLRELNEERSSDQHQTPVILIHGVFGSRLIDKESKKEVWPGNISKILFNNYQEVALPIDRATLLPAESNLEVSTITNKTAGQDFYGRIISTLGEAGGYMPGVPGKAVGNHRRQYYIFVYDWRQDNIQAARKLDQLIKQIRLDYSDPNLKVDIVAHSMGGLIARYYLRYGNVDVLNDNDFPVNNHGKSRVRKVILLGTPNLGSVSALQEFMQGLKVGLRRVPTEVLATMPSSYQLFPHPIRTPLIKSDGSVLSRDIFDVNIWRSFEWSIFNPDVEQRIIKKFSTDQEGRDYLALLQRYFEKYIERARRFVWSLTVPIEGTPVRLIVFGGDCEVTPASILVEEVNGESIVRLFPDEVFNRIKGVDYEKLMLEPGDGRVTRASLFARQTLDPSIQRHKYSFFPLDYSILLCESHDSLTGNINFQNNLLNILLTRDAPSSQE